MDRNRCHLRCLSVFDSGDHAKDDVSGVEVWDRKYYVTNLLVVLETILIFVGLLAPDDWTPEWFGLFVRRNVGGRVRQPGRDLSFTNGASDVAVRSILSTAQS